MNAVVKCVASPSAEKTGNLILMISFFVIILSCTHEFAYIRVEISFSHPR